MSKLKTYNHAFDIAWSMESHHPKGHDIKPHEFRNAIIERVNSLSDDELIEAIGNPFDTYEVKL